MGFPLLHGPRPALAPVAALACMLLVSCGGGGGPASSGGETAQGADPPAAVTSVKLRASAPVIEGVGASVTLRYNGAVLGTVEVRLGTPTEFAFSSTTAIDGGVLDLVFSNANNAQGQPARHLKIESLSIGSAVFQASDSRATFDLGDGAAAFDGQDLQAGRGTLVHNGALRLRLPAAAELLAATAAADTSAAGYYVDNASGDDTGPGTGASPWRTLARVANVRLKAGEGVYLRCGRTWRETLTLNAVQLVDGSVVAGYGPECKSRKALISAADDLSGGWQRNGAIWSRSLPLGTPKIAQLFIDGQPLRTAQWPDAASAGRDAALAAGSGGSRSRLLLQAADATALAGKDLAGATVQLRTQPWIIETRRATGGTGAAVELDAVLDWPLDASDSFVLQDKLWMLDAPGEFFHDTVAQKLYLIAPASGAPADINTALVEGTVRDVALALSQRSGIVVRDLALRAAREDGLRLTDAPQAQLSQLDAQDNLLNGLLLQQWQTLAANAAGPSITDSLVAGNGQYGIVTLSVERALISRNRVLATGTQAQHQARVIAAVSTGLGGRVEDNTIDGAGYLGIGFSPLGGSSVARNNVAGYCKRLSDCAAIYTWAGRSLATSAQSSTVADNRVFAAQAKLESAVSGNHEVVAGIYLDDFTRGVAVRNNTLAGTPVGVFLHNASDITVENNRIWLPTLVAVWASMDLTDADWMRGNTVRNNQIVPLVVADASAGALPGFATSQAVWFWHVTGGDAALAAGRNSFSANTVVQLQGPLAAHAWLRGPAGERFIDALEWQALNATETRPQQPLRYDALLPTLGPELLADGDFEHGLGQWQGYNNKPSGSLYAVRLLASLAGCSGACVSFTAGDPGDLLANWPVALRAGAPYMLRWTAVMPAATGATVGAPYVSRNTTPWDNMADSRGYAGYGPRRGAAGEVLRYETYFGAKSADPARLNLQLETLGVPVAFDNVSVREVTGYSSARAVDWSALAYAPAEAARSVGCAELGWPSGCIAIGLDGLAVALPLTVPAGSQQLLLRADSPFRR